MKPGQARLKAFLYQVEETSVQPTELSRRIRAEVDGISLIDTHEHLISEPVRLRQKIDLFHWFTHYASSDLVSAGMSMQTMESLPDPARTLHERWLEFAPFWKAARTTGYGRTLLLAARDLFDTPDINEATYEGLSEKISASNHEGWSEHVLKERANIALAILHPLPDFDPTPLEDIDRRLYRPVLVMNEFIEPCSRVELDTLGQKTDVAIHALDDLLKAMDCAFDRAVEAGVVGVKLSVAYTRSLDFEKVAKADAERIFNRIERYSVKTGAPQQPPISWTEAKPMQDYLVHQVVRRAIEHHLPLQVHTGLQAGNGNYLSNSNPLHLANLLLEYPDARFDLFHAGYPYQGEMATLGKNFANAYVDLCWVHAISPWVGRETLHEWIETVPNNKIFAFGGDYRFVEGTYSHAVMARSNVAQVLTEKVEMGYLAEDEAMALAHRLLHDNAAAFFRLQV
jgi:predicted TIM-barrel fold metal-dependent hydrolase